ncbi:MAG: hypothetical protein KTR25_00215 [Myxococcales bacterium]|nr:hypothetical protein [Myxococcales bacterium]
MTVHKALIPTAAGVLTIRTQAAVLPRQEVLSVRVEGSDRKRFLNGMLANDVAHLTPGQMQHSFKASAKGRVEGTLRIRCTDDDYILDLWEVSAAKVVGELAKFVVMDDVQLVDISSERVVVAIYGPEAISVLSRAGLSNLPNASLRFVENGDLSVLRDDALGVEGYEVHGPSGSSWMEVLKAAGAQEVQAAELDVVRVESGCPIDGAELNEEVMPLEAGLSHAMDLSKGCFIGQEVIARATHRGGVKRCLVGLCFEGEIPERGAELWPIGSDRARGWVSSAVYSPTLDRPIGLGFVHVDFEAVGTKLEARGGSQTIAAEVASIPHVPLRTP